MAFSLKELKHMYKVYDNDLIPTDPEDFKAWVAKRSKEDPNHIFRTPSPHLNPDAFDTPEGGLKIPQPEKLVSLADATIHMMQKDSDDWAKAMDILYKKEK